MAGCPPCPKADTKSQNNADADSERKVIKRPGWGRMQNNNTDPQDETEQFGVLHREQSGALGELIEYLLQVNEKIGSLQSAASEYNALRPKQDVLRLCDMDVLSHDRTFYKFITTMNNEFAVKQCIALSKLLTFAHDPRLSDPHQEEMKVSCLERWKVDRVDRRPVPWPLMNVHHSAVIHELLGDKEKLKSLNMLPREYHFQTKFSSFTNRHLSTVDSLNSTHIVLVCGTPSNTKNLSRSTPMLVYSRGRRPMDKFYTIDGEEWNHLDGLIPLCQPPLPPGTLVWAQATNEYMAKNGRRRYALCILDVASVYGYDCRSLSYRQRMNLAQRMCDIVNFPGKNNTYLRIPPMLSLTQLPDYVKNLPLLPCKDLPGRVPMHQLPDGVLFNPNHLLLVNHLVDPWTEWVSRSTGQFYYVNRDTSERTFTIPPSQFLPFTQTHFIQIPWTANESNSTSVSHLVDTVEHFFPSYQD